MTAAIKNGSQNLLPSPKQKCTNVPSLLSLIFFLLFD